MNNTIKLIGYVVLGLLFPFWIILAGFAEKKNREKDLANAEIMKRDFQILLNPKQQANRDG